MEFEENRLLDYDQIKKIEIRRHKNRMIELEYIRETELLKHNKELERMRIKTAEIRRTQERSKNY